VLRFFACLRVPNVGWSVSVELVVWKKSRFGAFVAGSYQKQDKLSTRRNLNVAEKHIQLTI
jgi:hypothetical protein